MRLQIAETAAWVLERSRRLCEVIGDLTKFRERPEHEVEQQAIVEKRAWLKTCDTTRCTETSAALR